MKKIFLSILVVLTSVLVSASDGIGENSEQNESKGTHIIYQPTQYKLGANLGWDHPYSAGLELSCLFDELYDVNIGFGLGMSGAKVGIGARYFPIRDKALSPMLGAYLYHATGIKELNMYVNQDEAIYKITPDNALLLNAGLRYRINKGHYLIGAIGYSIPFKGDKAQYLYGSRASTVETFANSISTGGLSLNVGVLIKVSSGHFIIRD